MGISLDKSAAYIAVMLGCWFAKKTFVPIDKKLPKARQQFIQENANVAFIMTEKNYRECLARDVGTPLDLTLTENHPAYIIYTSGSTGEPKSVSVSHNGIVNLADCQIKAFEMDEHSRYLFFLSTFFDASISDISVCLLSGATLIIEKDEALLLAGKLKALIPQRNITHIDIPPSLLKVLNWERIPECLKTIVIGGEVCDIETVRRWADKVNLVNVYGPTEATVCTSLCRCDSLWSAPLIGTEITKTRYQILDENKIPCPEGMPGELYISGVGLALGYINNEQLTQEKFIDIQGERHYRTGDYVVRLQNGDIQFRGRVDRQVKIRGQLIELEEVEAKLNTHLTIARAAVLKRPLKQGGRDILVAFVQPKENQPVPSQGDIQDFLRALLPIWMIPTHVVFMSKIPVLSSGKINQQALLDYVLSPNSTLDEDLTSEQEIIIDIFRKITALPEVSLDDNFFSLGGDSLGAVEFVLECERRGLELSAEHLLTGETPRRIASELGQQNSLKMSVTDLMVDIPFPHHLTPGFVDDKPVQDILLTGSTGFLGSALLKKLLETTSYTFHCLVRAPHQAAGLQRIRQTFSDYNLCLDPQEAQRIRIICGDIGQERLGLTKAEYDHLAHHMDKVYHCAATVNMVYSYRQLKSIDLEGVKRILQFCCDSRQKTLHYASTLSVFVSTDQNQGIVR